MIIKIITRYEYDERMTGRGIWFRVSPQHVDKPTTEISSKVEQPQCTVTTVQHPMWHNERTYKVYWFARTAKNAWDCICGYFSDSDSEYRVKIYSATQVCSLDLVSDHPIDWLDKQRLILSCM